MISPLTNERKFGDVNTEDFTTLGIAVVQNSSDIANKPSSSQVDSQIDTKNAAQLQQINLDYADRPTTYNKSEVYTKTESDASLALKGSAAQLATVTAYANTLPTLSTVNNVLNARFLLQDGENFLTFGALSDTTANTSSDRHSHSSHRDESERHCRCERQHREHPHGQCSVGDIERLQRGRGWVKHRGNQEQT